MAFVIVDRVRRMLSVKTSGFGSAEEVREIALEIHAAIGQMGGDRQDHVTLYNLSAVSVASADVVALFRDYVANEAYWSMLGRRMAFVSTSALLAMQLRRGAKDMPQITVFSDRAAAQQWLLANEASNGAFRPTGVVGTSCAGAATEPMALRRRRARPDIPPSSLARTRAMVAVNTSTPTASMNTDAATGCSPSLSTT